MMVRKRQWICLLLCCILMQGCGMQEGKWQNGNTDPAQAGAPELMQTGEEMGTQTEEPENMPAEQAETKEQVPDPEDYIAGILEKNYDNCSREDYLLLPDTEYENTVTVLRGAEEGPVVYMVCSLHGDEVAGYEAGNIWKNSSIRAGTLYILSPANLYGAEHNERTTRSKRDPNRYFPGKADGWDAEVIDWSIYEDIRRVQPDLVLDLHEAHQLAGSAREEGEQDQSASEEKDRLGNSIICQDMEPIADLVLDLMLGCGVTLYNSPPAGSLNRTVTVELGIPVITVETWRGDMLPYRIARHLEIEEFILKYQEMR